MSFLIPQKLSRFCSSTRHGADEAVFHRRGRSRRATALTCQKCILQYDIENDRQDRTPFWHLLREMLGNFLLRDDFKREAIH